jgi:putative hydrolase of the HAD superfamily
LDWGGTLADITKSLEERLAHDLGRLGCAVPVESVRGALPAAGEFEKRRQEFGYSKAGRRAFWIAWCESILKGLPAIANPSELAERLWDALDTDQGIWALYPDAKPALGKLRAGGLKLGIISNWDKSNLAEMCERLGVARFFDVILPSYEAEADKPDPAIFERALLEIRSAAAESVHVGDSIGADARGAEAVGICPVIVDRSGSSGAHEVVTVSSLLELPAVFGLY